MTIKTFAQAEARLAEALPGYESRPPQQAMARTIEQAIASRQHALIEAGCGTGKSLGAMIPAILSGKKVVVSTATIALMEQYANKDVPFLQEHLGVPFVFALLKGRSNYYCYAKGADAKGAAADLNAKLLDEMDADPEHDGDREHFTTPMTKQDFSALASSSQECPGKRDCPFGKVCLAEAAKDRAKAANLVVTNHAMLFTDLKVREVTEGRASMLGEYEVVVLDEAHEIEEIATNALGDEVREAGIRRLVTEVQNFAGAQNHSDPSLGRAVLDAVTEVWGIFPRPEGDKPMPLATRFFLENQDAFVALVEALRDLARSVSDIEVLRDGEKAEAKRTMLATRATNYVVRIAEVIMADDSTLVRWIERDEKGNLLFKNAPLHVGDWLTDWLWNRVPSILVSATLSVNGDFSYVQGRISLPDPITLNVGTPFDYDKQALLYLPPASTPNPKAGASWRQACAVHTLELIEAAQGGALLLFTSRTAMRDSYSALADALTKRGYNVYMQGGEDGSNKEIAAKFQTDTHSVLFALKSFFTGVDFAGDTCRLVVIDKMPFPVPTDVMFAARSAAMDRAAGKSVSFGGMSIPAMTLTLLQGFGRLIRTKNDRGVVAILDSRLVSEGYGRKIVNSLPDCKVTTDLAAVRDFYGETA